MALCGHPFTKAARDSGTLARGLRHELVLRRAKSDADPLLLRLLDQEAAPLLWRMLVLQLSDGPEVRQRELQALAEAIKLDEP